MDKKHLIWIIGLTVMVTFVLTLFVVDSIERIQVGEYDLYNCIYNNADMNSFPQHPKMIERIQNECICFREHNYTNLINSDCGTK